MISASDHHVLDAHAEPPETSQQILRGYLAPMLRAMWDADGEAAGLLADEVLSSGFLRRDLFDGVMAPALRVVGDRWQNGEVTFQQEHRATATAEGVLERLRSSAGSEHASWLVVTPVGEEHRVGALMAAATLEEAGQSVDVALGQTAALVVETAGKRAGVCVASSGTWSVREASDAALALARTGLPVVVGGGGFASSQFGPGITKVGSMRQLAALAGG